MRGLPRFEDPNLIVGAEGFSDAGVYRLQEDLLIVQSVDFFPPLVNDPFLFGQIAAANSLSDIYAMGGQPKTALAVVGFPDDQLDLEILSTILRGGAERVLQAGAVICGGHTVRDAEIKYGLSVTGTVTPGGLVTNGGARPGDRLVLTKALGTGFVTTASKQGRCPSEVLAAATDSMVQLNVGASRAAASLDVHAATDVTGFGLAGHALEMAEASQVSIILEGGRLPLLPGAETLALRGYRTRASDTNRSYVEPHMRIEGPVDAIRMEFVFDAQTSGGLLISVAAEQAEDLVARAAANGAEASSIVGSVVDAQDVRLIFRK